MKTTTRKPKTRELVSLHRVVSDTDARFSYYHAYGKDVEVLVKVFGLAVHTMASDDGGEARFCEFESSDLEPVIRKLLSLKYRVAIH